MIGVAKFETTCELDTKFETTCELDTKLVGCKLRLNEFMAYSG